MKHRLIFKDASHASAFLVRVFKMVRTPAQSSAEFSECSARERNFEQKINEILRMLRTGAQRAPFGHRMV